MALPLQLPWSTAQTRWKSQLDPVLANSLLGGQAISGIAITNTPLVIYHSLGQVPSGWILSDNDSNSTVWRTAWSDKSITLEASSSTTISIWVF